MEPACKLGGKSASTSSVRSKQKHLNQANCRDEHFNVNKLLVSRHSGRSCSCYCYAYVPVWAFKVDIHLIIASSNSIHSHCTHIP